MRTAAALALLLGLAACAGPVRTSAPGAPSGAAPGMGTAPGLAAADTASEAPVRLPTPTGELHGTLRLPAGRGPWPVVLVHPGSGPTDRDGNTPLLPGRNDALRRLAHDLARRGLASLRIDKRGVGASLAAGPAEADLRFDTYAADAAAWLAWLRADARFARVVALGHSEGAHVVARAARADGVGSGTAASAGARPGEAGRGPDALVLVAGAGRPAGALLREQLRPQLPPGLYASADSVLRRLEAGETSVPSPAVLAMLFRPSVQPYLASWLALDPAADLAASRVPALVVQGTTDAQVSMADAERLTAARAGVRLVRIDGMNHVLKAVSGDAAAQTSSYSDPTLPLAPGLVDAVAAFVLGLR